MRPWREAGLAWLADVRGRCCGVAKLAGTPAARTRAGATWTQLVYKFGIEGAAMRSHDCEAAHRRSRDPDYPFESCTTRTGFIL